MALLFTSRTVMTSGADLHSNKGSHEYPEVYGIHTHVIKYGQLDEKKRLILVIPGRFVVKQSQSIYECQSLVVHHHSTHKSNSGSWNEENTEWKNMNYFSKKRARVSVYTEVLVFLYFYEVIFRPYIYLYSRSSSMANAMYHAILARL